MPESLKKGIATKYLLPITAAYVTAALLLGIGQGSVLKVVLPQLGAASTAGILFLVFQDLLPRPAKEVLIFWRFRDRLPGCRAFSIIAKNDPRIDPTELAVLLPPGTMTPSEENSLWYRWLKSVEADPAIADNHHRFLALRDSAVLLLMLALVSPALALVPDSRTQPPLMLGAACTVAYLVTALAARNAGARLVGNVIARKVATS
jgi:hypothetical protein